LTGTVVFPLLSQDQDGEDNLDELNMRLKNALRDKADVTNGGGEIEDNVRLGEPGWKERYYEEKFLAKSPDEMEAIQQDVVCYKNRFPFTVAMILFEVPVF